MISAAASRTCISPFDTEEPMRHKFETTCNRSTTVPTELDGSLCSNLVQISQRNLGDVFCNRPTEVRMYVKIRPGIFERLHNDRRHSLRSNACFLDRCISHFDTDKHLVNRRKTRRRKGLCVVRSIATNLGDDQTKCTSTSTLFVPWLALMQCLLAVGACLTTQA